MTQPIPVICDQCRAAGEAGTEPFADLADLLSFTPVVRRARADGWDPERQRAFIAALAITGSPRQAARAIGKHAFGAEQLRKARGGSSFADAWDAAIDLARERELAALKEDMTDLAADHEAETGRRRSALLPAHLRGAAPGEPARSQYYSEDEEAEFGRKHAEIREGWRRTRERMTRARRLFLFACCNHADRRAAWELLVAPVDWDRARLMQSQADEPTDGPDGWPNVWSMREPDMLMTMESGLLAEFTGSRDVLDVFRQKIAEHEARIEVEKQAMGPQHAFMQQLYGERKPAHVVDAGTTPISSPAVAGASDGVAQQQLAPAKAGDGGASS